jgi:hypothetical protein
MVLLNIAVWPLLATVAVHSVPRSAGVAGPNIGWGSGLVPFLLVGVPVVVFIAWFEVERRKRKR